MEKVRDEIEVDEQMNEFIKLCKRHAEATQYELELLNKHGFVHLIIFMLTSDIFLDRYLYHVAIQVCVRFITEKNVGCFHAVIPTMVRNITEYGGPEKVRMNTAELFLCRFVDYAPYYLCKITAVLKEWYDNNAIPAEKHFFPTEQKKVYKFVGHNEK